MRRATSSGTTGVVWRIWYDAVIVCNAPREFTLSGATNEELVWLLRIRRQKEESRVERIQRLSHFPDQSGKIKRFEYDRSHPEAGCVRLADVETLRLCERP